MKEVTKTAKIRLYPNLKSSKKMTQDQWILSYCSNIVTETEKQYDKWNKLVDDIHSNYNKKKGLSLSKKEVIEKIKEKGFSVDPKILTDLPSKIQKDYIDSNYNWYKELKTYLPPNVMDKNGMNFSSTALSVLCRGLAARKTQILSKRKNKKKAKFNFHSFQKSGPLSIGFQRNIKLLGNKMTFPKTDPIKYLEKGYDIQYILKNSKDSRYGKDKLGYAYLYLTYTDKVRPLKKTGVVCAIDIGLRNNISLVEHKNGKIIKKLHTYNIPKYTKLLNKIKIKEKAHSKSIERRKKTLGLKELTKKNYSWNLEKQRKVINKLQHDLTKKRHDWLHKTTTELIKKYDIIILETLNVKGITASRKGTKENPGKMVAQKSGFNKKLLEFAPYKFKNMIKYKCEFYGKNIFEVPRFFPSTKKCNQCDFVNKTLSLKFEFLNCANCGLNIHRDLNAPINMIKYWLKNEKKALK